MSAEETDLSTFLSRAFAGDPPRTLGVAVSGGGDSVALLHLASDWSADAGVPLHAATVDHGLREGSAGEAATVAATCASLGVAHQALPWRGWDGSGNLQAEARAARYRLLGEWAEGAGIDTVALGHTLDDNAETLLMGLARGAGLDGLAGMRPAFVRGGVRFVRPLLGARRAALRELLTARGVEWIDDPSNDDRRFGRVRMRQALDALHETGVTADRISASIGHLRSSRDAIGESLAQWSAAHVTHDRGDLIVAPDPFLDLPEDFARRLLNAALRWVSGADYPPRADKVMQIVRRRGRAGRITLHGCLVSFEGRGIRVGREPEAAARAASVRPGEVWDGRWRLIGDGGGEVRALGAEGLKACPAWRGSGLPRASLKASPALWRNGTLIAAPLACKTDGWRAELAQHRVDFIGSLLSR